MRRKAVAAAVLALLCAATANPANAATSYREWLNFCGGTGPIPGLTMCGSVKLQVVDNHVQLWVQNLSGMAGSGSYQNFVFTSISFFNANPAGFMPNAIQGTVQNMSGPYRTSNAGTPPPPSWTITNTGGEGGVLGLDFNASTNGNDGAIASSCANALPGGSVELWMTPTCGTTDVSDASVNGGWISMEFDVDNFWDLTGSDTQLQIHAQSDLGSVKCTTSVDCPDPSTTTPEPATLALVGTGLAAMAAARRRRQRRDTGIEDV
ncbi:MAG TPA: PEP-CTERM sorting domain-containing protein [Longimicrobiaceae bacterium]